MGNTKTPGRQIKGKVTSEAVTTVDDNSVYVVQLPQATTDARLFDMLNGLVIAADEVRNGSIVLQTGSITPTGLKAIELHFPASELRKLFVEYSEAGSNKRAPLKFSQYPLVVQLGIIDDGNEYFGEVQQVAGGMVVSDDMNLQTTNVPVGRLYRKQFAAKLLN